MALREATFTLLSAQNSRIMPILRHAYTLHRSILAKGTCNFHPKKEDILQEPILGALVKIQPAPLPQLRQLRDLLVLAGPRPRLRKYVFELALNPELMVHQEVYTLWGSDNDLRLLYALYEAESLERMLIEVKQTDKSASLYISTPSGKSFSSPPALPARLNDEPEQLYFKRKMKTPEKWLEGIRQKMNGKGVTVEV